MSRKVEFFVLTFASKNSENNKNGNYYKGDFKNFFEKLEENFLKTKEEKSKILYRKIGDKSITISRFLRNDDNYFLIPFGKLKDGKTFKMEDDTFKELDTELFEVSSMVFNITNNVAIITKNRMGPSYITIEEYLNTFIPDNYNYNIKIVPLLENTDLSYKLDNAEYVRNVDIELEINDTIKAYYMDNSKSGKGYINSFVKSSIDKMQSQKIHIVFGFRYGKKEDTLDINCVRQIIDDLQINPEIVKQIKATCVNSKGDRQIGLLNENNILVEHTFYIKDNFLASEYLLNNCEQAFEGEIRRYRKQLGEIKAAEEANKNIIPDYLDELCLNWDFKNYYKND
nr:hypothetical protein [uncultured Ruminococcus sp.]